MDTGAPWRVLEIGETAETAPEQAGHALPVRRIGIVAAAGAIVCSIALIVAAQLVPPGGLAVAAGQSGPSGTAATGEPTSRASPSLVVVEVAGAVARPGVYRLPVGARVADAIAAAGGYAADVDARGAEGQLNLAARLEDAQAIRVPRRGETAAASARVASGSPAGAAGGPIDLNSASAEELDTLPGVGPVTAAKIIAAREERPFTKVDELVSRKIVSAATLAKLKSLVVVR